MALSEILKTSVCQYLPLFPLLYKRDKKALIFFFDIITATGGSSVQPDISMIKHLGPGSSLNSYHLVNLFTPADLLDKWHLGP